MSDLVIRNVRALQPGTGVIGDTVVVRDGQVAAIETRGGRPGTGAGSDDAAESVPGQSAAAHTPEVDGGGRLLTPGLIDIHAHGIEHWVYETDPASMRAGLARLSAYGVTCILPTLVRAMHWGDLEKLAALSAAMDEVETVSVPGLHLEGPFLALPGAGCDTIPGDVALLEALLEATGQRVWAMSLSPDVAHATSIAGALAERGIVGFMTHTAGTVAQTRALIEAGVRHATHFYDVFPVPEEGDPGVRPCGVVEAVLADERVSVDFIADGVHVDPVAIEMAVRCKGPAGVLAITDANVGAGLGEGTYPCPWGYDVRVREGEACRIHAPGQSNDGVLAGSGLTMDRAVSNLLRWLDLTEAEVWSMATRSVAERLGLSRKGDLRPGADADLVLWDREAGELRANRTWVAGRCVHERSPACGEMESKRV